jgi:hypothetical protein
MAISQPVDSECVLSVLSTPSAPMKTTGVRTLLETVIRRALPIPVALVATLSMTIWAQ